ncbi:MAG TPA: TolC family protein [Bacteroidales bacterium]|jgi:outer membrane protein|nr:TolC family protein [Bacteroidales bacterium]HPY21644.1 TolC family protein [Bacteroidales bacterium]HQA93229.1 TolC family protein [Bacteroidales bacterium]HQN23490.1 TolC family protein [Bacteroidales bacterium]HQP78431.1 TolC family protein [Bacteroidales bacterium]
MKRNKKTKCSTLIIALLIAGALPSSAQSWTLEQCISQAMEHNHDIRSARASLKESESALRELSWSLIPQIGGEIGHDFNWERLSPYKLKGTQSTNASIGGSITLFNGLRGYFSIREAGYSLKQATSSLEGVSDAVTINVIRGYLHMVLARELHSIAKYNCESIIRQMEKCRKMVLAGLRPLSSLMELEAQVAQEQYTITASAAEIENSRIALMQLLNLPYDSQFNIEIPAIDTLPPENLPEISAYSIADAHPATRAARAAMEADKAAVRVAASALSPIITLSAGYGTYYNNASTKKFNEQFKEHWTPFVGFTLKLPITGSIATAHRIKRAKSALSRSSITLEKTRRKLADEIELAVAECHSCRSRCIAAEKSRKASEELLRMNEFKLEVGEISATDYIISKNLCLKATSEHVQAYFQYLFQRMIVEHYLGR